MELKQLKDINIRKIRENFDIIHETNLKEISENLKCDKGMCGKYNTRILEKSKNFIYFYLPLPIPKLKRNEKVKHFLICKEPSARWAKKSQEIACNMVKNGVINFIGKETKLASLQILFLALLKTFPEDKFYITDLSKCAMNPDEAKDKKDNKKNRDNENYPLNRYGCCEYLLKYEIEKFTDENTIFYFIGKNSEEGLKNVKKIINGRKIKHLPHYSIQFSCPGQVIEMVYYYNKDISKKEVVDEIKDGYKSLNKKLSENFELNFELKLVEKYDISPTYILLYLVYKSCFGKN